MTATASSSSKQYPNGYSRYADIISRDPELSVYRRFRRLSARNLLYLQSELRLLEEDLDRFDQEDQNAEVAAGSQQQPYLLARSYDELMADSKDSSSPTKQASQDRINAITRLRVVMKEYQEALLLESQVLNLQKPCRRVMKVSKAWFKYNSPLLGPDWNLFDDEDDMVALRPAQGQDRLSIYLQEHFGCLLQKPSVPQSDDIVGIFAEKHIIRSVNVITIIAAFLLLFGGIALLYYVKNGGARIGIVGGLTLLFGFAMSILTNARRPEIIGTTAAYAAVLVVFIGGDIVLKVNVAGLQAGDSIAVNT